ncbi:MAG TPA: hypothetical protein VHB20_00460 [Verrucomicrobiae bacterium]|nr:hypothetical protein [Verrucomicrobiae bacterium]
MKVVSATWTWQILVWISAVGKAFPDENKGCAGAGPPLTIGNGEVWFLLQTPGLFGDIAFVVRRMRGDFHRPICLASHVFSAGFCGCQIHQRDPSGGGRKTLGIKDGTGFSQK